MFWVKLNGGVWLQSPLKIWAALMHSITTELGTLPVSCFALPEDALGLRIAWVYDQDKGETDEGCDERGDEKVGDGSKGNHAVHLGIQTGSS